MGDRETREQDAREERAHDKLDAKLEHSGLTAMACAFHMMVQKGPEHELGDIGPEYGDDKSFYYGLTQDQHDLLLHLREYHLIAFDMAAIEAVGWGRQSFYFIKRKDVMFGNLVGCIEDAEKQRKSKVG